MMTCQITFRTMKHELGVGRTTGAAKSRSLGDVCWEKQMKGCGKGKNQKVTEEEQKVINNLYLVKTIRLYQLLSTANKGQISQFLIVSKQFN